MRFRHLLAVTSFAFASLVHAAEYPAKPITLIGVPGYQSSSWYGILAPAGTPRDVVMKLDAALVNAVQEPEVRKALANEGADPIGSTPEEFAAHIRAELDRTGKVVRAAKLDLQ